MQILVLQIYEDEADLQNFVNVDGVVTFGLNIFGTECWLVY